MGFEDRSDEAREKARKIFAGVAADMAKLGAEEIVGVMARDEPEGREYADSELGRTYQASARGEPPAERTGEYADSYGSTEAIDRGNRVVAAVTNDRMVGRHGRTPLWAVLEYRLGRPHVRPGTDLTVAEIRRVARKGAR